MHFFIFIINAFISSFILFRFMENGQSIFIAGSAFFFVLTAYCGAISIKRLDFNNKPKGKI